MSVVGRSFMYQRRAIALARLFFRRSGLPRFPLGGFSGRRDDGTVPLVAGKMDMNSPWFRYRDVWAPEVLSGCPFAGDAVIAGGLVASWHD